ESMCNNQIFTKSIPKTLVLIPARYESSRFPGKPLAQIAGKSMIERTFTNAAESNFEVVVVTDHPLIEEHVRSFGGNVVRVDDQVNSGSDRIYLAYKRFFKHLSKRLSERLQQDYQFIINLQGDEPLLPGSELVKLPLLSAKSGHPISTLIKEQKNYDCEEFKNPNVVKVIFSKKTEECLYFSRASIPHFTSTHFASHSTATPWYQHIGVYCYSRDALERFVSTPPSSYELSERLEQLRALEMGIKIGGVPTVANLIAVDTPQDIIRVEDALKNKITQEMAR
ncbi:MAG: 3-deoxy-manno-octulosonate cytidylyltransferase, partial [Oligoflexia bacterium]|nr:3-deoxy-manno-octulosonate cytidylyltransferase [Oligoflexia bacterium]